MKNSSENYKKVYHNPIEYEQLLNRSISSLNGSLTGMNDPGPSEPGSNELH